jgi:hypothetical protein
MSKIEVGVAVTTHELFDIHDKPVRIPDPERLVHLQFRRFAGCPICNLHMRSISRRHDEIVAAGVREVVVFHSSADAMREFQGLPADFLIGPDGRVLAVKYGSHADDQWSVDELLDLASAAPG